MRPHDLQSSNFFPTNPYDFADILTQKKLISGIGISCWEQLGLQDKGNMLVGMRGFLDTQVQKGIISGQLHDPLILKRDNMQKNQYTYC